MTEFSTKATLEIQVDRGDLRSARKEIEDQLTADPIQVEVEQVDSRRVASSSRALSSNGGRRRGGGSRGGRSKLLESQNSMLSSIDSHWTENIELNDTRNALLRELLDETEKGNTTTRGRIGGSLGGGGMLGIALGGAVLSNLSLPDLPELKVPEIPPLKIPDIDPLEIPDIDPLEVPDIPGVPEPDWAPVEVPKPDWLPIPPLEVPDIDPLEVPDIPGVPEPDWAPIEIHKPDWIPIPPPEMPELPGSPSPSPSPTPSPTPTPPVGAPDGNTPGLPNIDIPDVNVPEISPKEIGAAGGAAATGAAGWLANQKGLFGKVGGPKGLGSKAAGLSTPLFTREMFGLGSNEVPDLQNGGTKEADLKSNSEWIRDLLSGPADPDHNTGPKYKETVSRGPDLKELNSNLPLKDQAASQSSRRSSMNQRLPQMRGRDLEELANQNVDLTVKPNINVSAEGVSKKEVERKVKDGISQVERDLSKRLDDLERAFK